MAKECGPPEVIQIYLNSIARLLLEALANNLPFAEKHRDHALTDDWKDHRDCHVKPEQVLIYRRPSEDVLQLVRLGSHSELGL